MKTVTLIRKKVLEILSRGSAHAPSVGPVSKIKLKGQVPLEAGSKKLVYRVTSRGNPIILLELPEVPAKICVQKRPKR